MQTLYKNPIALILVVLCIAAFVYFEEQLPSIDLSHLTPGNVVAVLGYLSVIMLVVEQFIEIFVDDPDQTKKKQCRARIELIDKQLYDVNNSVNSVLRNEKEENDDVIAMIKEKKELEQLLIGYELKRQRRTMLIGFVLGLMLSFSGLRLMSGIIFNGSVEKMSAIQATIIQSIDIILTAGIIAGGSDRVHGLIKRIKSNFLSV
ncbi:hypothetical protein [Aquimarina sediminis]|uniref:hypothetical protein n=1 Tax=Aquimarina sediminis TaxID=2070536 RepID=UPI000CA03220|nr:hypothetical protein [Aquimarina sediminis]